MIQHAEVCLPWIGALQGADISGRFESGTEAMKWPMIPRAPDDMGYAGPVGLEAHARNDPELPLRPFMLPSRCNTN